MKILKLRFLNINSLTGEWEIDFSQKEYENDGIFAICGPTGAGKSSILDAICIALYGQTPRTGKITENNNEVMSRNTGEFFSEVVFEAGDEIYVSNFRQRRAKKDPDGNLQTPKHEIAYKKDGKVIANKLREVCSSVEAFTGMDFERFTRSMLLAQNKFAEFLQARPDERAPMLEQITGMEIYSNISIKVHEINRDYKNKLEILNSELGSIQLITEDEVKDLIKNINEKEDEIKKILKCNSEKKIGLELYKRQVEILDEHNLAFKKRHEIQIELEEFKAENELLEKINRLSEFSVYIDYRNRFQKETSKEIENLKNIEKWFEENNSMIENVQKNNDIVLAELEKLKFEKNQISQKVRLITPLDIKLKNIKENIKTGNEDVDKIDKKIENLENQLSEQHKLYFDLKKRIEQIQKYLSENDLSFINSQDYIKIREMFSDNQKNYSEIIELEQSILKNSELIKKKEFQQKDIDEKLNQIKKELDNKKSLLETEEKNKKDLLQNRNLSDIFDQIRDIDNNIVEIKKMREIYNDIRVKEKILDEKNNKILINNNKISEFKEEFEILKKEKELKENNLKLMQQNIILHNKIKNLEDLRKELKENEPCPLCGSCEHPYFKELKTENYADEEKEVNLLNIDLEKISKRVIEIEKLIVSLKKENEMIEAECENINNELDKAKKNNLISENEIENKIELLNIQKDTQAGLTKKLEIIDNRLSVINKEISYKKELLYDKEKEKENIHNNISNIAQKNQEDYKKITKIQKNITLNNLYITEIAKIELQNNILKKDFEKIVNAVIKDYEKFIRDKKEFDEITKELEVIDIKKTGITKEIKDLNNQKDKILLKQKKDNEEFNEIYLKKDEIYSGKDIYEREIEINEVFDETEKKYKIIEKQLNDFLKTKNEKEVLKSEILKKIDELVNETEQNDNLIRQNIKKYGFKDIDEVMDIYSKKQFKKEIEQKREDIYKRKNIIDSEMLKMKNNLQDIENRLKDGNFKDLDNLTFEFEENEKKIHILNQEKGFINQKIDSYNNLKAEYSNKYKEYETLKKQVEMFGLLHNMIGSSDGKRFRNFAQGLTFELVIKHANRNLKELSDRYFLKRDDKTHLELSVVDNYQGGIIRSVKNLSGGESFIVSLALALGLSEMNSKKIHVGSLFLDEGFGTLDEDSLNTALETLASLKHSGKIIGLISHIQAIKDTIPLQINVVPIRNGKSSISGPGVRKI